MIAPIITIERVAAHAPKKGKTTCLTCRLKGCVGKCHFKVVSESPRPAKTA
jgi:hypothetical protein